MVTDLFLKPHPVTFALALIKNEIQDSLYVQERFPLIIDPSGQAARFLKYQLGAYVKSDDIENFTSSKLNRALVGALQFGRTLTLSFETLEGISKDIFQPKLFPVEVINRPKLYEDGTWQSVFKRELGDPNTDEISPSPDFVFVICTATDFVPEFLSAVMNVIVLVQPEPDKDKSDGIASSAKELDGIAELYGAKETVRYLF
jgi:hypothetical protein